MLEGTISDDIRVELTQKHECRLFTNPCGKAWVGKFVRKIGDLVHLLGGHPIDFGLEFGSPDLVGWRVVTVTPDMVGTRIALFVGIEVKQQKGKMREKQKTFMARMVKDHCLCGIARSVQDAINIVRRVA